MVIKYTKLGSGDSTDPIIWMKTRLPIQFLKQQKFLVSLVGASLLLFVSTTLFVPEIDETFQPNLSSDLSYGVIVDCGSSGSRAHIFGWGNDLSRSRIELVRDKVSGRPLSKQIVPGLSTFRDNPDKSSDYMEPIMDFISETIPQEKHLDTPVFFMATAGLRLLEQSTQRKILADITRDLKAKYNFPKIRSQVISGEYEGVYSWLSLNANSKLYSSSSQPSYGMIELGGASAQVTFELDPAVENSILKELIDNDAISAFKAEQVTLKLGSSNQVKLFATSFLGLGVNSARESSVDLLTKDYLKASEKSVTPTLTTGDNDIRLLDPCLPSGSSENILRPKTLLGTSAQSIGFVMKEKEPTVEIHLQGSGNFLNCMSLLQRTLEISKKERLHCPADKPSCPMALLGTKFVPYSHYPFVGLSEMYFTTNEMLNSAGHFNRSKILHETKRVCNTPYDKLLQIYGKRDTSQEDRVLYECFKASWLLTILHNFGLQMPDEYNRFETVSSLNGNVVDWTVGAMMSEVALRH